MDKTKLSVDYFGEGIVAMTNTKRLSLLKQIRVSKTPWKLSKSLVKKHRKAPDPCPDLSAAQEARVAIIRRLPENLKNIPAHEVELCALERSVIAGKISQGKFDALCQDLGSKELPVWMREGWVKDSAGMPGYWQSPLATGA